MRQNDDKLFTDRNHLNFKIVQETAKYDEIHPKQFEEEKHEVNSKNFSSEKDSSEEASQNPEDEIEIETRKIKYNG